MNEQEQQLISGLAERVRNAPVQQIDHDADDLIRRTIGARPDGLYILTQTVLLQEMALDHLKAQVAELQQRVAAQSAPAQSGFLPSTPPAADWGRDNRVQQSAYQSGYAQPGYAQPGYAQPGFAQPGYAQPSGGGIGGFLRSAASAAAGMMAGEIAFDSLASIFGHRGGGLFGGGGFFGGGGGETIVNNYYGDESGAGGGDSQFAAAAANSDDNISPDIEDERGDSGSGFFGGDSGSGDDGSSFDDGGSFDGGGSDN